MSNHASGRRALMTGGVAAALASACCRSMRPCFTAVILAAFVAPAWSATKTVTLSVPGMNWAIGQFTRATTEAGYPSTAKEAR